MPFLRRIPVAALLTCALGSCTTFHSTPGGPNTPGTLKKRMAQHQTVLQQTIGPRSPKEPKSMEAAARYIENNFSDMGYAVTLQPVSGAAGSKNGAICNIIVYKPGLYADNKSIVIGANYDSNGRINDGSGAALLMETARELKDIPTNHNIYFVAYANGADSAAPAVSSGAGRHAKALSEQIGPAHILGMVNLEPCHTATEGAPGHAVQPAVLFMTTPRGQEFAGRCAVPFSKSWKNQPSTVSRGASAIGGNDRHYAAMDIPTLACQCDGADDGKMDDYVQALTDMVHEMADIKADSAAPSPANAALPTPVQANKPAPPGQSSKASSHPNIAASEKTSATDR